MALKITQHKQEDSRDQVKKEEMIVDLGNWETEMW